MIGARLRVLVDAADQRLAEAAGAQIVERIDIGGEHAVVRMIEIRQADGDRSALLLSANRLPSKTLVDSMTRSSVSTAMSSASASGAIVSCARCIGEAAR